MNTLNLWFIGLGLIGGSMPSAVRRRNIQRLRLLAYDFREDSLQLGSGRSRYWMR